MKGRAITYSAAEMAWLKQNRSMIISDYHAAFASAFDRPDVSASHLHALRKRKGWRTGRTGHFVKGKDPHNKGKPHPSRGRSTQTQFKRGNLPHNAKGPGHERIDSKDGYVVLIVDEVNPWTGAKTRPVHKHVYLWEQINGPIPKGHCLKCLDGNKRNTDPSNWELISRGLLPRLNGGKASRTIAYDSAPAELKPAILTVAKIDHAIKQKREKAA
jgi:hypothetical protein